MFVFMVKLMFLPARHLGSPDFIVVSSTSLLPILNGYLLRRKFPGSKFILEIRDIWPLTLVELSGISNYHPLVMIFGLIERFGYRAADWITSTINRANNHVQQTITSPFNFTWIGNGIMPENYLTHHTDSAFRLPPGKINVTYCGTIGTANALEFLVEAAGLMAADTSVHFNIFGDGYLLDKLKLKAKGMPNITFYGRIPNSGIFGVLEQSDLLYLGWRNKSIYKFGISANKLFEYMLSAKPILMSGNHIADDPVTLSGGGFVVPSEDPAAIVEAISKFKSLAVNQRLEIGAKAKEYVLKNHTYRFLAEKYEKVFEALSRD
jgi:glycosyltransferase involved in cell wall biosynthesis